MDQKFDIQNNDLFDVINQIEETIREAQTHLTVQSELQKYAIWKEQAIHLNDKLKTLRQSVDYDNISYYVEKLDDAKKQDIQACIAKYLTLEEQAKRIHSTLLKKSITTAENIELNDARLSNQDKKDNIFKNYVDQSLLEEIHQQIAYSKQKRKALIINEDLLEARMIFKFFCNPIFAITILSLPVIAIWLPVFPLGSSSLDQNVRLIGITGLVVLSIVAYYYYQAKNLQKHCTKLLKSYAEKKDNTSKLYVNLLNLVQYYDEQLIALYLAKNNYYNFKYIETKNIQYLTSKDNLCNVFTTSKLIHLMEFSTENTLNKAIALLENQISTLKNEITILEIDTNKIVEKLNYEIDQKAFKLLEQEFHNLFYNTYSSIFTKLKKQLYCVKETFSILLQHCCISTKYSQYFILLNASRGNILVPNSYINVSHLRSNEKLAYTTFIKALQNTRSITTRRSALSIVKSLLRNNAISIYSPQQDISILQYMIQTCNFNIIKQILDYNFCYLSQKKFIHNDYYNSVFLNDSEELLPYIISLGVIDVNGALLCAAKYEDDQKANYIISNYDLPYTLVEKLITISSKEFLEKIVKNLFSYHSCIIKNINQLCLMLSIDKLRLIKAYTILTSDIKEQILLEAIKCNDFDLAMYIFNQIDISTLLPQNILSLCIKNHTDTQLFLYFANYKKFQYLNHDYQFCADLLDLAIEHENIDVILHYTPKLRSISKERLKQICLLACKMSSKKLMTHINKVIHQHNFSLDCLSDENHNTILHIIVENNFSLEILNYIYSFKTIINIQNSQGHTALYYACKHKNLDNVRYLLQNNAISSIFDNPVEYEGIKLALYQGIMYKSCYYCINVDFYIAGQGYNIIHYILTRDNEQNALNKISLLIQIGFNVNYTSKEGISILTGAIDKPKVFDQLLTAGANPYILDYTGNNVLAKHISSRNSSVDLLKILVKHNYDLNILYNGCKSQSLFDTIINQKLEDIQFLLEHGVRYDKVSQFNDNILHTSLNHNRIEIFLYLISYIKNNGISKLKIAGEYTEGIYNLLYARGYKNRTILHAVVNTNDNSILKLLIEDFDLKKYLQIQDEDGYTPLHHAVLKNSFRLIEYFLSIGANKNIVNKYDYTPLKTAIEKDHNLIIPLLQEQKVPAKILTILQNEEVK